MREAYLFREDGFSWVSWLTEEKLAEIWGPREISSGSSSGVLTTFTLPISESSFQGLLTQWFITESQGSQFGCNLRGTTGTGVED